MSGRGKHGRANGRNGRSHCLSLVQAPSDRPSVGRSVGRQDRSVSLTVARSFVRPFISLLTLPLSLSLFPCCSVLSKPPRQKEWRWHRRRETDRSGKEAFGSCLRNFTSGGEEDGRKCSGPFWQDEDGREDGIKKRRRTKRRRKRCFRHQCGLSASLFGAVNPRKDAGLERKGEWRCSKLPSPLLPPFFLSLLFHIFSTRAPLHSPP